eukprot:s163_g27.t1
MFFSLRFMGKTYNDIYIYINGSPDFETHLMVISRFQMGRLCCWCAMIAIICWAPASAALRQSFHKCEDLESVGVTPPRLRPISAMN